jgi:hypothetical protein
MRKARDRTAVAVRLSSIPISLGSIPFNDNSRRRSSSAVVQSFTDDLLSPIGSVIGLAPASRQSEPSMRQGSASVFYFADVTYFFPGLPRRPKMELSKRSNRQRIAAHSRRRRHPAGQVVARLRPGARSK